MTRTKNVSTTETSYFQGPGFFDVDIRYSNLFGISIFDIRILPEQDFRSDTEYGDDMAPYSNLYGI